MKLIILSVFIFLSFFSKAQTDTSDSGIYIPDLGGETPVHKPNSSIVYAAVQEMPEFPGGEDSMMRFIGRNILYPKAAIEKNIVGRVRVKFTVTASGEIKDAHVLGKDKLGYGCEEAAIAVINKMPKWKPGRQNNQPVAVYFNIPISFKLE